MQIDATEGSSARKDRKEEGNQAAVNVPSHAQHQSSLKTRLSHPLKFIPLPKSCDTYKYSFWPRTIVYWNNVPFDYLG